MLIFVISIFIQYQIPLSSDFFSTNIAFVIGSILIVAGVAILLPALIRFYQTNNTLITIKPANSLQTSGIYAFTRNPMYLGLLILYVGLAFLKGNFWTFILIPVIVWLITFMVIKKAFHANIFNNQKDKGYKNIMEAMKPLIFAFKKPVLAIYGDTHTYQVSQPLRYHGQVLQNFTALQVFGSPDIHLVKVIMDSSKEKLFDFEPVYMN